jgi:hypothetical protein
MVHRAEGRKMKNATGHAKQVLQEKTIDALASRITRLERLLLWAATLRVGWMAAQHTGFAISLDWISWKRGQLSHKSHGVGRDLQESPNNKTELKLSPRSPPHPPTLPTTYKNQSLFEGVTDTMQNGSIFALRETMLSATGEQQEETTVVNNESKFCLHDVCGVETFCDSLTFQRWNYLRDEKGIGELDDRSALQHDVACHLLIEQQRSPYEPDLNMEHDRLLQTFAMTALLWGDEHDNDRREEVCQNHRIRDGCEFVIEEWGGWLL